MTFSYCKGQGRPVTSLRQYAGKTLDICGNLEKKIYVSTINIYSQQTQCLELELELHNRKWLKKFNFHKQYFQIYFTEWKLF